MAQFVPFADGIEVRGASVLSVLAGMNRFEAFARQILAEHGIVEPAPDRWYSQDSFLRAFRTIAERIGPNTLYSIGKRVPEHAKFPDDISGIEDALGKLDVAYHMNHRRAGVELYDPQTGRLRAGIGSYGVVECHSREALIACRNPYPCAFDHGLVTALAERYRPANAIFIRVEHDPPDVCRQRGAAACRSRVGW